MTCCERGRRISPPTFSVPHSSSQSFHLPPIFAGGALKLPLRTDRIVLSRIAAPMKEEIVPCSMKSPLTTSDSSSKLCEECKTNASKYRCPGCSVHSCSLPCVKAHKQRTGCTGKRQQQTQFVPLSQFDDNLLLSDYNMLEDVKRFAESAERTRVQLCGNFRYGIPFYLKNLLRAAGSRRTRLLFLPNGMSKRETNKTYYNYKKKFISWTIEWRFHSTNVKLIDHGVDEKSNLYSVIESHLKPYPRNHPLKPFTLEHVESLKFFIRKNPKGSKSPFRELDINAPIRDQLANLVIIEYPVIHVYLPSHTIDFEIVKDPISHHGQSKKDLVNNSQPSSPNGVFFMEEEIKDDSLTDPHVLDLMNQSKNTFDNPKGSQKDEVFVNPNDKDKEIGVVDFMDFEFDPELSEIYSHLILEPNPDEFLDLERLLSGDMKLSDEKGEGSFNGVSKEELEEGEIADSD